MLLARTGMRVIDPRSLGWMVRGDSASHLAGWLFFAREPWQWPPGRIATWLVPEGTSIGFADAIPLLAFPAKLLAGLVATPFQYFGLWIAACLVLHGLLGRRLLVELGADERAAALGGALLALGPVAWERFQRGHESLGGQWLVVAALLLWLRMARRPAATREAWYFAALVAIAALVHPYLLLLVVLLFAGAAATAVCRARRVSRGLPVAAIAAAAAAGAATWAAGFVGRGGERLVLGGWDRWSADLGALLQPQAWSRYFTNGPAVRVRTEGLGYLGAGVLALAVAALVLRWARRERQPGVAIPGYLALWIATVVLALLAVLPKLRLFGVELVDLSALSAPVESVLGVFRANGRLLWPLHAWAGACIVAAACKVRVPPAIAILLLVSALALQAFEPRRAARAGARPAAAEPGSFTAEWPGYRAAAMLPPYLRDGFSVLCGQEHPPDAWVRPALLAAGSAMTFDSGYVARLDPAASGRRCERARAQLAAAALEPGVVYFVRRRPARVLDRAGADCRRFDRRLWTCVAGAAAGESR